MRKNLEYEQIIRHLEKGYENTQSVARFIDAKASAVIGGCTTILGLNAVVIKWLNTFFPELLHDSTKSGSNLFYTFCILCILIMLCRHCIGCLSQAFKVINPGDTGKSDASALFPFIPYGNQLNNTHSSLAVKNRERVEYYENTPKQEDAVHDYTEQLKRMGEINYLKITRCNSAIDSLKNMMYTSLFFAIFTLIIYVVSGLTI